MSKFVKGIVLRRLERANVSTQDKYACLEILAGEAHNEGLITVYLRDVYIPTLVAPLTDLEQACIRASNHHNQAHADYIEVKKDGDKLIEAAVEVFDNKCALVAQDNDKALMVSRTKKLVLEKAQELLLTTIIGTVATKKVLDKALIETDKAWDQVFEASTDDNKTKESRAELQGKYDKAFAAFKTAYAEHHGEEYNHQTN